MSPRDLIRKRYGHEIADQVISFWNHWHIEEPQDVEEALYFFIFGGEL